MRLTLSVTGATIVRSGLENLANEIPQISRQRIYMTMNRAMETIKVYPPERPNQVYVRTYRLKGGWFVMDVGNGYRLQNYVFYTSDVVGNAYGLGQGYWFVGRWKLVRDVVDAEVRKLPQEIDDNIKMVARRDGL